MVGLCNIWGIIALEYKAFSNLASYNLSYFSVLLFYLPMKKAQATGFPIAQAFIQLVQTLSLFYIALFNWHFTSEAHYSSEYFTDCYAYFNISRYTLILLKINTV